MPNRILSSLIEKISNYATRINSEAGFVDKSWTYIDEDGQPVRLLFKGNSRLLINQRGRVTEGSWEFIPQWGGLVVEIEGERALYNQAMVFDDVVMVLRIDGSSDYLPLSDDKVVLPNEIQQFLEKLSKAIGENGRNTMTSDSPVKRYKTEKGEEVVVISSDKSKVFNLIGAEILQPGMYSGNYSGSIRLADGYRLIIKNGKVNQLESPLMETGVQIVLIILVVIFSVFMLIWTSSDYF